MTATTAETIPRPRPETTPQDLPVGDMSTPDVSVTIIEAQPGWRLVNVRELVEYRDLFRFLVWRSIKLHSATSVVDRYLILYLNGYHNVVTQNGQFGGPSIRVPLSIASAPR